MLVDSHCHLDMLDLTPFDGKLENVLRHANQLGVTHFLCVAVSLQKHDVLVDIANTYPNVAISVGNHPNNPKEEIVTAETLCDLAQNPKVVAIGETGLDYHRSSGDLRWQQERFVIHIEAAKASQKPIIIHSRDAQKDTMSILKNHGAKDVGGVFHCFSGDWEMAKFGLDLGFYISFSGVVTFKNAHVLQDIAKKVPLDKILIETDCPFLTPDPYRGKPNYPGYLKYIAEQMATLRKITFEEIAKTTTQNYQQLFFRS